MFPLSLICSPTGKKKKLNGSTISDKARELNHKKKKRKKEKEALYNW